MKRLILLILFGIAVLMSGPWVTETMATCTSILSPPSPCNMTEYSAVPPFVGNALPPNVLLLMDNSGSMQDSAYHLNSETYDPTMTFGGYFEQKCYTTSGSGSTLKFVVEAGTLGSCTHWDGNFLNFISMEKLEVTKFVMMGGKCSARNASGNCLGTGNLIGETTEGVNAVSYTAAAVSPFTGTCNWNRSTTSGVSYITITNSNSGGTACGSGGSYSTTKSFALTVVPTTEPTGIIQQVGGKARFGLMEYNTSDGGHVLADVGSTPLVSNATCASSGLPIINAIECTAPTTNTPLAESLYEASRYFAQIAPAFSGSDYSYTTTSRDPYYFNSPAWLTPAQYVPCCKSFVIMFTDGQPTQDMTIPSTIMDYAHTAAQHGTSVHCAVAAGCTANITAGAGAPPKHSNTSASLHNTMWDHHDNCSNYYGGPTSDPCTGSGGHYLDDVAYWAHTTDLRQATIPPIGAAGHDLPGMQNITLYTFFAFGTGSNLLKDAAMVGGFNDLDGDGKPFKDATCGTASPNPLCQEWDADGDGVPDTYFESANAFTMRDRLMAAITDILKRSSSGTSVSILSTTETGEGALYQAYFYPSKFEGLNNIQWLGYLQGLFLDSKGNLREDSNQNQTLDLTTDKIVKLVFDPNSGQTVVQRFDDANGDGTPDSSTPSSIVTLDQLLPIWEAGKLLALRADTDRHIYTWVDQNNDGLVTPSEFISFDSSQAALLRPYLNTATTTLGSPNPATPDATNVINFIRGANITGYRDRSVTVNGSLHVWKLGDIIYSTPVTVGKPMEQYDLVYKDSSYEQFIQQYQTRRDVVYVGANDGMLHAFNAGTYDPATKKFDPGTGHVLGEELWAYVPYNLLPHLRWLTDPNYTHVYYVDQKPKVVDAKIFSADADHPGGWGTVLIGGLRLGGGTVSVTDNFGSGTTTRAFQSSFFALDITNPEKPPVLLWTATRSNMGFTTSFPAVARVANSSGGSKWVVIMGSGPTNYIGNRGTPNLFSADIYSHLYVFDLSNGTLLNKFDNAVNNEFLGDVTTLDGNLDYGVDTVYVGSAIQNGTAWNGNLYRVVTKNDTNPANWHLSTLYSAPGPILEAPSLSIDSFLNLWVYFGTGRFLSANDKAYGASEFQAMYGIKDEDNTNNRVCWQDDTGCTPVTTSQLLDVSNASVDTDGTQTGTISFNGGNISEPTFTDLLTKARDPSVRGWVLTFSTAGERVLAKPVILAGVVLFSTFTPTNDVCGFQGEGKLYATYFETGSAYSSPVIGTTGNVINRSTDLGQGVPSMAGLHIGTEEGVRGFVQQGTGSISEVDGTPPFKFKSGVMTWQEKQM